MILKDAAFTKEHVKKVVIRKPMIKNNYKGVMSEMEKLNNMDGSWYIFGLCVCNVRYDGWWEREDESSIGKN
jgi:hypothetical protein